MFWQCGIFCFSIRFFNCSDSVVFFAYHFISVYKWWTIWNGPTCTGQIHVNHAFYMYIDVFSLTITINKMKIQNIQIPQSNSNIIERGEIDISNALMDCYSNLDKKKIGRVKMLLWAESSVKFQFISTDTYYMNSFRLRLWDV